MINQLLLTVIELFPIARTISKLTAVYYYTGVGTEHADNVKA